MNEMITKMKCLETLDFWTNFRQQYNKKCMKKQWGKYACWFLGLWGLIKNKTQTALINIVNFRMSIIFNNYSLKSIFLKPLFTDIEKNNCFSIYTRSELNKIRKETIKKFKSTIWLTDQITRRIFKHGNSQACHFANNSVMA